MMRNSQSPKNILLGVSGGIAAYKIPQLVRMLTAQSHNVKVVLTESAFGLVGETALRTLTGFPVYSDRTSPEYDMNHIGLARWADVYLIAPATANTIGKITHGIADNLLTSLFLSCEKPVLVAPAMNTAMWNNPAVQDNIKTLASRNVTVLPVGVGELACGEVGAGRMADLETIAAAVECAGISKSLLGKRVLISSGPTQESIDPVRVITNLSSGTMGSALASAALAMGAEVTVVTGPASAPLPCGIKTIRVQSAHEMKQALDQEFDSSDLLIMAAAISDYTPEKASQDKLARTDAGVTLNLKSNPDILQSLAQQKKSQIIVGFSLESGAGLDRAREKMVKKGCDLMVYNTASESLATKDSAITLISKTSEDSFPLQSKLANAQLICQAAAALMEQRS